MPGMFFDTLERIDQGPRVKERDFDMAIATRARKLAEKYGVAYDPAQPVPHDDALADRLFEAGMEMAVQTGLWVLDTEKTASFSEAEIWRRLDNLRYPIVCGYGKDQVILEPRKPDSTIRPLVLGGAAGSSISEGEMYVKHMMGFALEPTNDMLVNGNPHLIEGREVRPASPLEIHGAIQELGWMREAMRRAGRPGMPLFVAPGCSASHAPAIAIINEERGLRRGDFIYAAILTELKTDYDRLNRAIAGLENGIHVVTLLAPMIGGWAGGPAGAAVSGTAACILAAVAYDATIAVNHPVHMSLKNGATTHRQTLWVQSVVGQAMARNTRFPIAQNVFLDARSGTRETLYEAAANAVVAITSGQHLGPGPSGVVGGEDLDMVTAMELRVLGEVTRAVTGMHRSEANGIVVRCLDRYESTLGNPPSGKRFEDLYDVAKMEPSQEWLAAGRQG